MYSFYVFEGSFHQGGGGWEDIEVSDSLPVIQQAAVDYIRLGNWAEAIDNFIIRVYQAGRLVVEADIYPFLQVKVPELTTISFRDGGRPQGGEPEPGSEYEEERSEFEEAEDWIAFFLNNVFQSIVEDEPDDIEVTIDWARLALPELEQPVLPEGEGVYIRQVEGNERAWGEAVAVDGDGDRNDLQKRFGYGRYITSGYNSMFL